MDPSQVPVVIVESPYAASKKWDITSNMTYLKRCLSDCIDRGEAPFASHALYTSLLDDSDPKERELGIKLGYAIMARADKVVFYVDRGYSSGMLAAKEQALAFGLPIEERTIPGHTKDQKGDTRALP